MTKSFAGDPETQSPNSVAENVERLKSLLPEAITEGRIADESL